MSLINNKKSLFIAIVLGALVFVIVGCLVLQVNPSQAPVQSVHQYVIAKTDIKKGDTVKEENVEIKDLGVNIDGTYKATGEIIGRVADKDIVAGRPIMKAFIKEIVVKEQPKEGELPKEGFRAVPMLVRKSSMPPYITTGALFDLFTKENSMKIENLKILNILDPSKDQTNKMLVLEIKNSDVATFINYQVETKGFIFLQKNPNEYGNYKFYNLAGTTPAKTKTYYSSNREVALPPINKLEEENIQPISNLVKNNDLSEPVSNKNRKAVEVIVGNNKTTMEFED